MNKNPQEQKTPKVLNAEEMMSIIDCWKNTIIDPEHSKIDVDILRNAHLYDQ